VLKTALAAARWRGGAAERTRVRTSRGAICGDRRAVSRQSRRDPGALRSVPPCSACKQPESAARESSSGTFVRVLDGFALTLREKN
jgi:hypothetical protein